MMMHQSPFVQVSDLGRDFDLSAPLLSRLLEGVPKRSLTAASGVSFSIERGETFALVGESGSGKSTIGKMLVGLLEPTSGGVTIDGKDLFGTLDKASRMALRRRIQMIFQNPYASLNPRWRVGDIIAEPITAFGLAEGKGVQARVSQLLEQVGLNAKDAKKYPHEFSGGQRQRIAIARALASEPEFIVCDEPTSALDVSVQSQVLNLMRDLQRELGLAYLFISHDLSVVRYMADKIGVLYLGELVEVADRDTLFAKPRHPYTQMLIDAAPRIDAFGRTAERAKGEIPDPIDRPSGCSYHPRCPVVEDICRRTAPEAQLFADGRALVSCHRAQE